MLTNVAYFHPHASVSYLCFGKGTVFYSYEVSNIDKLQTFLNENKGKFIYGYIGYDAKNGIEQLASQNADHLNFPLYYFYVPTTVYALGKHEINCIQGTDNKYNRDFIAYFLQKMKTSNVLKCQPFQSRISKQDYLQTVVRLQEYIQRGDIYEVNFCQEFFSSDNKSIDPLSLYGMLDRATKAPFSCYLQHDNYYVLCCSPERFIQKSGQKLISQPIKGTAQRGNNDEEDEQLKKNLKNNLKEQAENVMIVDLVRNDLSKIAIKGSVKVDELLGVYSFETVHQLISAVSCELPEEINFSDIIRSTFPMGSMTGCPKIRALQLIEKYESFRRGLYSGTIGYLLPNGDFDFNVVIRSVLYNSENGYLSCGVGGAITINSQPEEEYIECETKIRKIIDLLQ